MKKLVITAAALTLAIAVPVSGMAQGRHDEKPHGVTKAAPATTAQARTGSTGGRHDEGGTTHAKKKAVAKKAPSKAADVPADK